ncbi:hypothetical protein HK102_003668, partial [Quaeritorhiza haematococci]
MPLTIGREPSTQLFLGVLIATIILEIYYAVAFVALYVNRQKGPVKRNSFTFLSIIVLGCMVQLSSSFPGYTSPSYNSPAVCHAVSYLVHLGFALAFGGILLKVYRIYRIFSNKTGMILQLADTILLQYLAVIFVVFLCLLFVQTFATPLALVQSEQPIDRLTTSAWDLCVGDQIEYLLLALEILMLTVGAYLAVVTRKVDEDYNEAQSLGVCVYNVLFVLILAVIVDSVIASSPTPETKHLIHFVRDALTTATVVSILCVPKHVKCRQGDPDSAPGSNTGRKRASTMKKHQEAPSAAQSGTSGGKAETEGVEPKIAKLLARKDELEALVNKQAQEIAQLRAMRGGHEA